MNFLNRIEFPDWTGAVEILILALIFYYILQFFRGTRGAAILTGFSIFFAALIVITRLTNLQTLNWLLQKMMVYLALALIVIFQPEVRRALARLGRQGNFLSGKTRRALADPIADAVRLLASRKIGALIAIERETGTKGIQDTGVMLNSDLSAELLATLFFPGAPLHDGGVIISGERIAAAGCVFPLTQNEDVSRNLGTRHRAAIGMTEESDTVVIVVSEETGAISIAYNGRLKSGLDLSHLRRILSVFLGRDSGLRWLRRRSGEEDSGQVILFAENTGHDE